MSTDALRRPVGLSLAQFWQGMQMPLLAAAGYLVGAEAAFLIGTLSDRIFAPFWPPNIVLFCALVLTPRQRWWVFLAAAFPAHVIAEVQVGMPAPQLVVAFVTNCMVALLNAAAIQRLLGEPPWFDSLRKASIYIGVTVFAAPAVAALGGAFVPILGGGAAENYWAFWAQWYLSNALGSVTLGTVALIVLSERPKLRLKPHRLIEAVLLTLMLTAICAFVFTVGAKHITEGFMPALLYAPLPIVLWAAIRYGAKGASGAVLIVTVVLIWCALNGPSVFVASDAELSVLAIQTFLIGLASPVLLLGAAIEQTRRAERAIRESEERMTLAALSSKVCMWSYDHKSSRFWMSDYGHEIFGLRPSMPITREAVLQAIHPDDRPTALSFLQGAARLGSIDEIRVPVDGQARWLRVRASEHLDDNGAPSHVAGTFVDVTERKAAELDSAQRRREVAHLMRVSMLGELSGGLAHELTQPLTAILSNAQAARLMMDEKRPDLKEVAAALDDIILEDNRAGEVIHRLRSLLKKGEARFEQIDVNDLVRSTLQLLHSEFISRRVKVDARLSESLPPVAGDAVQLQQVLINLMINALDAVSDMATGFRMIAVSGRCRSVNGEEVIEVAIVDQGAGLPPDYRERLFQPFFSTKDHGLGLGLSICASIIKAHGGALTLESRPEGGAIAAFILPVANESSRSVA